MQNTVLCYLEKDGKYLMLYRNAKKNDVNGGKWVGVGGHIEENESPDEAVCREVREETGLTLNSCRFRGVVTFVSDKWEGEYMYLYTSSDFSGELSDCDEGELHWINKGEVMSLPMWAGDVIFLQHILEDRPEALMLKVTYRGDELVGAEKY